MVLVGRGGLRSLSAPSLRFLNHIRVFLAALLRPKKEYCGEGSECGQVLSSVPRYTCIPQRYLLGALCLGVREESGVPIAR